ncbi:MAG: transporter substrate-binding domain-containing protein [Alphaproteobacteria bacterium]
MVDVSGDIVEQLAPTGELRAGINLGNFLLVTGRSAAGEPVGVAPDMARALADRLGVPVRYVTYGKPSELADAVTDGAWDVGLIGAEPQRAEHIAFTKAYCEIEATYLVPAASDLHKPEDADQPGRRIVVAERTAYGLWLDRNIRQAELLHTKDHEGAIRHFVEDKLDALAGLRPRLVQDVGQLAGTRLLDGRFMAVQQAIGTPIANDKALGFLADFVESAIASGLVAELIARHEVNGLSVARGD